WRVTPFLLLGTVFSNLSGFLGTNYIVEKQTTGVLKTSVYGGIISIIMNILLIPTLGIEGAGISSFVSFLIMYLIRYYDTRKYISVKIKWNELITSTLIIIFQILILYISFPIQIELILNIFLFLILLVVNKSLMKLVRLLIERFWIKFINDKNKIGKEYNLNKIWIIYFIEMIILSIIKPLITDFYYVSLFATILHIMITIILLLSEKKQIRSVVVWAYIMRVITLFIDLFLRDTIILPSS